jgi:hypothetical protein
MSPVQHIQPPASTSQDQPQATNAVDQSAALAQLAVECSEAKAAARQAVAAVEVAEQALSAKEAELAEACQVREGLVCTSPGRVKIPLTCKSGNVHRDFLYMASGGCSWLLMTAHDVLCSCHSILQAVDLACRRTWTCPPSWQRHSFKSHSSKHSSKHNSKIALLHQQQMLLFQLLVAMVEWVPVWKGY